MYQSETEFLFYHRLKQLTGEIFFLSFFFSFVRLLWVLQKFVEDVDKRRHDVDEIRTKASELLPKLSQHDTELVEERIR